MKGKVLQTFRDKENDLVEREEGKIYEFSAERGENLINKGFIEAVVEPVAEDTEESVEPAAENPDKKKVRETKKKKGENTCL